MWAREREREKIKHNTTNGDKESEGEVEKSKVRAFQNRCGRKIKAKTTNGQNERKEEIRGAREKSQSSYGLWRRRSVLICFQVVLPERISHFVSACLQSKLFVNASRGCLMTHLYDALLLLQLCSAIQLQPQGRCVFRAAMTTREQSTWGESKEFRDNMTEVRSRVQQRSVLSNHTRFVFPSCGKKSPNPRLRRSAGGDFKCLKAT